MNLQKRKIVLILVTVLVLVFVYILRAPATHLLTVFHTHSYRYLYMPFRSIDVTKPATQEPATAVPILMYHGVRVEGELGTNITRTNFIEQMEMLKREGYETISVHEYDLFREGQFVLPPKPIIITFDDGRKDSFYTVDEIFRKLGFKATIFIATIKADTNDPFFLSWEELRGAKETGRWEIEAHGQRSHDEVLMNENGERGLYLASRIYDPVQGLESIEAFENRVRTDYENGIKDLVNNLEIMPRYFAVPLNDYGGDQDSNYHEAIDYNKLLTKEYFTFAFIQALDENNYPIETFYNYKNSNPFSLKRLGVKNMSANDLQTALNKFAPSNPSIKFPGDESLTYLQLLYGHVDATPAEIVMTTDPSMTASRILVGDRGWENYSVKTQVTRGEAREATMVIYYQDESNHVRLDWDTDSIELTERIDAVNRKILDKVPLTTDSQSLEVQVSVHDGLMDIIFDGVQLVKDEAIHLPRGAVGFGVWDPEGSEVKITSLEVSKIE